MKLTLGEHLEKHLRSAAPKAGYKTVGAFIRAAIVEKLRRVRRHPTSPRPTHKESVT